MPTNLPRVKEGDVVSADLFNALIDAANSCGVRVGQSSGLTMSDGPGGTVLGTAIASFLWAKTTGAISGGAYPWKQIRPASGGTWTDGTFTGTAIEYNGNASVASGTRIRVWRTPAGKWVFFASAC